MIFPLGLNDSDVSIFQGLGPIDYVRTMSYKGLLEISAIAQGRMITPEGDSLRNVLLIREEAKGIPTISKNCETLDSAELDYETIDGIQAKLLTDSVTTDVEYLKWYAMGYRYPVMEQLKAITYFYGNPVDSARIAYYIPPICQKLYLMFDEYNDSIRQAEASICFFENIGYSSSIVDKYSVTEKDQQIVALHNKGNVEFQDMRFTGLTRCYLSSSVVSDQITIIYDTHEKGIMDIKIYTTTGVLLYSKEAYISDASGQVSCPVSQIANGGHIVMVKINGQIFSFKIIKNKRDYCF